MRQLRGYSSDLSDEDDNTQMKNGFQPIYKHKSNAEKSGFCSAWKFMLGMIVLAAIFGIPSLNIYKLYNEEILKSQAAQESVKSLANELKDMKQRKEIAEKELMRLKSSNDDLLKVSDDFQIEVDKLKGSVMDLTKENTDLTKQNEDLTKQNDDLTKQNDDLKTQIESLEKEKNELAQKLAADDMKSSPDSVQKVSDLNCADDALLTNSMQIFEIWLQKLGKEDSMTIKEFLEFNAQFDEHSDMTQKEKERDNKMIYELYKGGDVTRKEFEKNSREMIKGISEDQRNHVCTELYAQINS